MSLCAEEDDIPWDSIRDNRDLTVFTSWDPKERSEVICSRFAPRFPRVVLCCICLRVVVLRSQAVSRGAPAPFSGRGDCLAENTLPHASPRRLHGVAGAHVCAAERSDDHRERSGRQGVDPQQPPVAAQPDVTHSISAHGETCTGIWGGGGGGGPSGGGGPEWGRRTQKLLVLQYPFLGPPSTRLAPALSVGSCQCQAAALQLCVHLQELELLGLGKKTNDRSAAGRRLNVGTDLVFSIFCRRVLRTSNPDL